MRKFLFSLFLSIIPFSVYAQKYYDFAVGDFDYRIISVTDRTVSVAYVENNEDGIYVIPENIEFEGVNFSVIRVDGLAFGTWDIKSVTIPPSIKLLQEGAFYNGWDGIETIIISDSPEVLDCTALMGINDLYLGQFGTTQCKNLYLGRDLDFIPYSEYYRHFEPFYGVGTLEKIEVGKYVTDISHLGYAGHDNLKELTIHALTPPKITDTTFEDLLYITLNVKVPAEALETYRSAKNWSKFVKLTAIEENSVKVNVDYDAELGSVYVNKTLYNGELIFEKGTDLEVTIQPARGKEVSSVLVNGVERIGDLENNTLYLDGVEENLKIEVKFSTPNCMIRLVCGDGGAVAFPIASGGNIELSLEPEAGWVIKSVYVNNVDMTSQVQNARLPLNNITADQSVAIVFEKKGTSATQTLTEEAEISITNQTISIVAHNESIGIYDLSGSLLHQSASTGTFAVPQSGIYIIKVGSRTYKVAL